MMLKDKRASQLSIRGCSSWAGLSATTCGWTIDGVATRPNAVQRSGRVGRSRVGRHYGVSNPERGGVAAGDRQDTGRIRGGRRPVGLGFVESLARPAGNITGFAALEFGVGAKWLELLKEVAPGVTRVAVLRDLTIGIGYLAALQAVAPALGVELTPIGLRDAVEVERAVTAFAHGSADGMIVPPSTFALTHRELIATVAARHRLPAVYGWRYMVTAGGLISYGPNSVDQFRRAAGYVDRILKGEKPADLPV